MKWNNTLRIAKVNNQDMINHVLFMDARNEILVKL